MHVEHKTNLQVSVSKHVKIPQKTHMKKIKIGTFFLENVNLKSYSSTRSGHSAGIDQDSALPCATSATRVSLIVGIFLFYFLF